MKLIVCRSCRDVVALDFAPRECKCSRSMGLYLDNDRVRVAGDCFVIGIENGLRYGTEDRVEAFVISEMDRHVERVLWTVLRSSKQWAWPERPLRVLTDQELVDGRQSDRQPR